MKTKKRTQRSAEILLASIICARSTGYLFSKLILEGMGVFNLLAVRFLLGFLLLAALFLKRLVRIDRRSLIAGLVMGGMFFLVMTAELNGLKHTASSTISFLENTAIVLVPLLQAALSRSLPRKKAVASALLSLAGVGLLTLSGTVKLGLGELFGILSAILYAAAILTTDKVTHSGIDALAAGIVQVGTVGALSLVASLLTETPRLPMGAEWIGVVMLAVVCTGFGFTLQPVAQSGTTADRAGMFCAINPLVASVLGVVFLHEQIAPQGALGAVLILAGILLSELPEEKLPRLLKLKRC